MSLKETYKQLKDLLTEIVADLEKGEAGNKAAAQRVRTGTVKLEKVAKLYRKESISSEKKNKGQKRTTKSAGASSSRGTSKSSSTGARKSTAGAKSGSKTSSASRTTVKAKGKAKTSFRPRAMSIKRATAKLPIRRISA